MHVEVSTTDSFANHWTLPAVHASQQSDFSTKLILTDLPSDQEIFYRVRFAAIDDPKALSEAAIGRFRTVPQQRRSIRFAWSGDTAGQGWGIDTQRGGMLTYATMQRHAPDFFIHSGDNIYADNPILAEQAMPDGEIWRNLVEDGVGKVAESLDEFRGRWRYNLLDANVRSFNAHVPTYCQWDDHEVVDNWSPSKSLMEDNRYTEKSVDKLVARSRRALHEMTPIRPNACEPGRIYRTVHYGPLLDVFMLDLRSYRGPNNAELETRLTADARILGEAQSRWLAQELTASKATWKVIASDMPVGLVVWDDWETASGAEAIANGVAGVPIGRELEIAKLLRTLKADNVKDVIWLTADVHYTAAHHYHPDRATFREFDPFWEFVSGPLHAGTFDQVPLDTTFGPEVVFVKAPSPEQGIDLPPSEGMQFFGLVDIDGETECLTVRLMDRNDTELYRKILNPAGHAAT
jgi:alkaline phosphatase D